MNETCQSLTFENICSYLFNIIKNAFYFILKALFFLVIFSFLHQLFGYLEKQIDKKAMINFKIYDMADLRKNNYNTYCRLYQEVKATRQCNLDRIEK